MVYYNVSDPYLLNLDLGNGALKVDLTKFQTNLVPYPRTHFPLVSIFLIRIQPVAEFGSKSDPELDFFIKIIS